MIADNMIPAVSAGISTSLSAYMRVRIEHVQPTGSTRMYSGAAVSKSAMR